ncbi:HAD-IB family phosphatase [Paenibacillus sp. P26]|nr:HAD-IB family phosphatase [Paenibacillus sp. P26]
MSRKRIIFCDFDGTITVNDNIVAIMKHFQPEGWDTLVQQVISKELSVREGVGRMFALLPTERKREIVDYAIGNVTIRNGFREPLAFCRKEEIEFYVTSGASISSFTRCCRSFRSPKTISIATEAILAEAISGFCGRTPATANAITTAVCAKRRSSALIRRRTMSAF